MNKVVINACYGGFTLSDKAVEELAIPLGEWGYPEEPSRHDPKFVELVERLGKEASGSCSRLEIREIWGRVYRIDVHDGLETVVDLDDSDAVIIDDPRPLDILRELVKNWDVEPLNYASRSSQAGFKNFAEKAEALVRSARAILAEE